MTSITLICVTSDGRQSNWHGFSDQAAQAEMHRRIRAAASDHEFEVQYHKFIYVKTTAFEGQPSTIIVVYGREGEVQTAAAAVPPVLDKRAYVPYTTRSFL